MQFSQIGDADGHLSLKCCIVIMLTHLALNYNLLGKHSMNPDAVEDQILRADMVSHLVAVTRELRVESSMRRVHMYTAVRVCGDPLFLHFATSNPISQQICWMKALSMCKREMSALILKHGITTGMGYDPMTPHSCNMKGCLIGHIALLTQVHQSFSALCFPSLCN